MYQLSSNLYIFQEDRIGYRPVARQIIQSPSGGSGFVGSSGEILGDVSYLPYNYGISTNPESFAVYGGDMFCVDAKRNAVLKIRGNQIENIAANGMKFYFDAALQAVRYLGQSKIYGGYDREFDEYVVGFDLKLYAYNLTSQSYSAGAFGGLTQTWGSIWCYPRAYPLRDSWAILIKSPRLVYKNHRGEICRF